MTKSVTSLARWVSVVAHPFVMVFVVVAAATYRTGAIQDTGRTVGTVALFAIVPVAVLTVRQVRKGAWETTDASRPEERPLLYVTGIAGMAALVAYLIVTNPGSALLRGSCVALGLLIVCAVTSRWIKVSLHVTAAALTATALIILGSPVGWVVAGVVPLLMWSRLVLKKHRPIEVTVGLLYGVAAGIAMHFP